MSRRPLTPVQRAARVELSALTEAWLAGCAAYWERRAQQFADARPRPDDTRRGDPIAEAERYARLTAQAEACRARATGADGWCDRVLAETATDLAATEAT